MSMVGTWMQQLALSFLAYKLTQSPFMLGLIAFASQAPSILLGPFAGVLPDLFNRHKLLIATQTTLMIQSIILTWLAASGHINIWQLIALGIFAGAANAVDMPTRQAFVIDMTEKTEDLPNVIALNSSLMNLTRLLGPALAGVILAKWGETACFLLNSISFLAVIAALIAMKLKAGKPRNTNINVLEHLKEGFNYVRESQPMRFLLIATAMTSLCAIPYMILLPVYVKSSFHGDASLLAWMTAASSIGALTGTILLASRKNVLGLGNWLIWSLFIMAFSLPIFAYSHNLFISLFALALAGFGMTTEIACSNTILQTLVDDDKRGRVMSLFTMCFMGMMPIGGLAAGYFADRVGCSTVIGISGIFALILAVITLKSMPSLRRAARPLYVKRGIIAGSSS